MQMPVPAGQPMRLPAQVAGSLSRLQGQLQAARPQLQNAYAMHWLAHRYAGFVPEFQTFTQHMLWGAYSNMALSGLLRHALSGRATPEVMGGIVDQLHLMERNYGEAARSLEQVLQQPDVRELPGVEPMVGALRPIDQFMDRTQTARQTVTTGFAWQPGPMLDLPGIRRTDVVAAGVQPPAGRPPQPTPMPLEEPPPPADGMWPPKAD